MSRMTLVSCDHAVEFGTCGSQTSGAAAADDGWALGVDGGRDYCPMHRAAHGYPAALADRIRHANRIMAERPRPVRTERPLRALYRPSDLS